MGETENPEEPTLEILPTMGWVCRTLHVSQARVWSLVQRGKLSHPTNEKGELVFVESEVLSLQGKIDKIETPTRKKKRDEGELYSVLFAHFEAKTPFPKIVIQEKVSPETVRLAHKEYLLGFESKVDNGILSARTRAELEILARKERIKQTELEIVETRARSRESIAAVKSQAARAKSHENTLAAITGARKQ